ncbi:hypothetical protein ABTX62_05475 [Streptomyces sp. NPDC096046]|uniref:hypothetical protein n=1 Tax=Streptomyces sp. NPDC096046 TaxID=3155542 RepID=UPI003331C164
MTTSARSWPPPTPCFINWAPKETRQVRNGDWRRAYKGDFGDRIDGVGSGRC